MDELEISGKRYVSSRRAARDYHYHADYIGQLVRSGKVKGQKVGRAWYVDEVSLAKHLGKEVVTRKAPTAAQLRKQVAHQLAPELSDNENEIVVEIKKEETEIVQSTYVMPEAVQIKKIEVAPLAYGEDVAPLLPHTSPQLLWREMPAFPNIEQGALLGRNIIAVEESPIRERIAPRQRTRTREESGEQKMPWWKMVTLVTIGFITFMLLFGLSITLSSVVNVSDHSVGYPGSQASAPAK